jgi:hypothetical protein
MDPIMSVSRTSARADVVQDQPLPVHARCYGRMIFLLKDVSQDDDPNIFMGQACLQ